MNKKVDEEYKDIKDVYILQCICSELKSQLQQKENIIKEVREYAIWQKENPTYDNIWREYEVNKLLEMLERENI